MRAGGAAVLVLAVFLAGCGGSGGGVTEPPPPPPPPPPAGNPVASATVEAGATTNTFSPARVDLTRNGTVTWTFGALAHNVTFATVTGAPGNIPDTVNQTVSRTFPTAGTFTYSCTLHAGMSGTVVVQ